MKKLVLTAGNSGENIILLYSILIVQLYLNWFYSVSVFIKNCRTDEESIEIHRLNQLARLFPDYKFTFQEDKQG